MVGAVFSFAESVVAEEAAVCSPTFAHRSNCHSRRGGPGNPWRRSPRWHVVLACSAPRRLTNRNAYGRRPCLDSHGAHGRATPLYTFFSVVHFSRPASQGEGRKTTPLVPNVPNVHDRDEVPSLVPLVLQIRDEVLPVVPLVLQMCHDIASSSLV